MTDGLFVILILTGLCALMLLPVIVAVVLGPIFFRGNSIAMDGKICIKAKDGSIVIRRNTSSLSLQLTRL